MDDSLARLFLRAGRDGSAATGAGGLGGRHQGREGAIPQRLGSSNGIAASLPEANDQHGQRRFVEGYPVDVHLPISRWTYRAVPTATMSRRGDASPAAHVLKDRRGTCARWVTPYLSRCRMTYFCALQRERIGLTARQRREP